jgi:hypothetical protein
MRRSKINNLLLLLWLLPLAISAGEFQYHSEIDPVDSTGFYRIRLSTEIVGQSKEGLTDFRIFNARGEEVPYILERDLHRKSASAFSGFQIVQRERTDSLTSLVLHNRERLRINNIRLVVGNADVQKEMKLTGSNNLKDWYSVKESDRISVLRNPNDVYETMLITFPLVEYEYLRLEIDDRKTSPVNIREAGFFISTFSDGDYMPVASSFVQRDSLKLKKSFVDVKFEGRRLVERISFVITEPELYHRRARVFYYPDKDLKNQQFLTSITFKSGQGLSFELDGIFCYGLVVEIENEDNPPLVVAKVEPDMLNHYCVVRLQKGEAYLIKCGNTDMTAPRYDLAYFKELFQGKMPEVQHGVVIAATVKPDIDLTEVKWYRSPIFIWIAIIFVILLLGYVTYGMLQDKSLK